MSSRKSTVFYGVLIGLVSLVVGMVIAARLDLTPSSFANTLNVPALNSAPLDGPVDATTFRNIAKNASPSVVTIIAKTTRQVSDVSQFFGIPNPFGRGGGGRGRGPVEEVPAQSAGSGFIIDKAGFILTNNHVIEDASAIEVRLSTTRDSEEGLAAKVVGRDELTDTALLQLTELPSGELPVAKFGDSAQMAPGDWVMAIGNPFGLSNTVTVGVVSAVGRDELRRFANRSEEMIQTDAAINQGNSGGPLLNIRGEVIGINTMIVSNQNGGGNVGVGFAVPINTVSEFLPQLRQGKITRGRIGVSISEIPISGQYAEELGLGTSGGAEISTVIANGPAAKAGLRVGDVIVEYNGRPVRDSRDLVNMVTRTTPGTTVPVKVVRDRRPTTINVTVEELDLAAEQGLTQQSRGSAPELQQNDLGMSLSPIDQDARRELELPAGRGGAVVTEVRPFSSAAMSGLQEGDVILSVQGQAVRSVNEVMTALNQLQVGRTVRVIVWRGGQEQLLQVRKR